MRKARVVKVMMERSVMRSLPLRERQVLDLVWDGLSHREIAQRLGISPKTVSTYLDRLFARFDCQGSVQLIRAALAAGLLSLSEPVRNS